MEFPIWMVSPFLCLLLCIALLPILAGHFWHNNLHKGLVSAGLSVPVLAYLIIHQLTTGVASFGPLLHAVEEYIDFMARRWQHCTSSPAALLSKATSGRRRWPTRSCWPSARSWPI